MADKLYKTRQQEINKRTEESEGTTEDTQLSSIEKPEEIPRETTEIEQENQSRGRVRRRGCGVRVLILPNPQSYPLILS